MNPVESPGAGISVAEYIKFAVPLITATGGVVIGAVKFALNGSAKAIREVREDCREMKTTINKMDRRLVRVETKLEIEAHEDGA